ncbi:MAG: DUF4296 domain-containing protein [bacterium]
MDRLYKYLILSILVLFAASCSKSKLSRAEMVDVLYEIHFAEATVQVAANNSPRVEKQEYYNVIFEKYGITKDFFDKSVRWYSNNPKEYKLVYEALISKAEVFKSRVDALEFHPDMRPTRMDSIGELDLWYWHNKIILFDTVNYAISPDSLYFALNDSAYFELSDTLQWKFRIAMRSTLFGDSSNIKMMLNYGEYRDTVLYRMPIDSVKRAVSFTKVISDSVHLMGVELSFVDNLDSVSYVEIDSIALWRKYNKFVYSLSESVRKDLDRKRDSVQNKNIEIVEEPDNRKSDNLQSDNSKLMVAPIKNR